MGVKPNQINGFSTGLLGLSEFSSPWIWQVLLKAPVDSFSDVVKVSELDHGTGTWINNEDFLI